MAQAGSQGHPGSRIVGRRSAAYAAFCSAGECTPETAVTGCIRMQIELDREQKELIERAVASGRLRRPEEAIQEALALWIERERRREEILTAIDEAERSVIRGESIPLTELSIRELAEDVKRRGRARSRAAPLK